MQQRNDTPTRNLSMPIDINGEQAKSLTTRDLFQGRRRIDIEHQGECYRLQITRRGKLILTK